MANVIFDFDGTIADTLPLVIEIFDRWSGKDPITAEEVERYRNMTVRELLREIGVPLWRMPGLLVWGRAEMTKTMPQATIFEGLAPVFESLSSAGHRLFVASSNSQENIDAFLKRHQIDGCFSGIYGNIGVFGKTKVIKNIIREEQLDPVQTYCVGDEVRDIEAAKKAGVKAVAVGWGYNGNVILQAHKPDYFISRPNELMNIVATSV